MSTPHASNSSHRVVFKSLYERVCNPSCPFVAFYRKSYRYTNTGGSVFYIQDVSNYYRKMGRCNASLFGICKLTLTKRTLLASKANKILKNKISSYSFFGQWFLIGHNVWIMLQIRYLLHIGWKYYCCLVSRLPNSVS